MNLNQKQTLKHSLRSLAWILALLLVLGLAMEGWRYSIKPVSQPNDSFVDESIQTAAAHFEQKQQEFLQTGNALTRTVERQLRQGTSRQSIYETLDNNASLWGGLVTRNDSIFVWSGFTPEELPEVRPAIEEAQVTVQKQNNVIFWLYRNSFTLTQDADRTEVYRLYLTSRIQQTNALPIGKSSEYHLLDETATDRFYPVHFTFFNPLSTEALNSRPLHNTTQDSIGAAYALPGQLMDTQANWVEDTRFWRSIFVVFALLCLGVWGFFRLDRLSPGKSLITQSALVLSGWILFIYANIPMRWIPEIFSITASDEVFTTYRVLARFAVDGIFIFLLALALSRNLDRKKIHLESYWYPATILIALAVGVGNVSAILALFYKSYMVADQSDVLLMSLQIIPPPATVLYYLILGLLLFSTGLALVAVNRFLIKSGKDQKKLLAVLITTGFLMALLIAQLYVPEAIQLNWALLLCIFFFGAILSTSYMYINKPDLMDQLSTLRSLVIGTAVLSLIGTVITYQSFLANQDQQLKEQALAFSEDEDPNVRELTGHILTRLEQELRGITPEDFNERVPFIQSEFTSNIEELVINDRQNYSIDLQLIKPNGALVADYSTNLNSPDWVRVYDILRLSVVVNIEQITKQNNRPIVQLPELINKQDYSTFSRGWIPLFGEEGDMPIAWILCSVYKERPNFNKPIRAVMASLTYNDWSNSYLMLNYRDEELISSFQQGVTGTFPKYNKLRFAEVQQLESDSLFYYTSSQMDNNYRNLIWQTTPQQVLKVSTIEPDYQNVLFSFFRLNFTLLISACFIALVLHFTGAHTFALNGKSERFKNRILDNFLLATLIFLLLLVVTTHYAIKHQNEDIVRQELFDKLESLTQSTENNIITADIQTNSSFSLDSLVTPLNVDASFYENRTVTKSTTPQIYQQHLLPETMPFPVYRDLFNEQLRDGLTQVSLASQDLLIGFRSVLSPDNKPVAAIAIPTFLQSPKYDQQLLETTSYLIILYLVIFGVFIVGTTLVSSRLTRPLVYIQRGLNKISKGDLDTKIPVTSNDEIGNLANAYNEMVTRLKELQDELATAEREAAWKEMAQQVAHEIKNPLTPIKLNIQHLERQLASNDTDINELKPRIQQITKNIIAQIQSLNNIASDFSKFSQPINKEFENVNINELIHSVSNLYQHDDQTDIVTELTAHNLIVEGVDDELRRVIVNLIKNAFEAMPDGGIITVRCYTHKQSVFIEVIDDGVGIPEEDKSRIFVPNFSTKSSGTGLGLAICKKIVEAHRGSISFASIEGKGTTFIIKLPLKKQEVVQESTTS